jgi:hypothetical protein
MSSSEFPPHPGSSHSECRAHSPPSLSKCRVRNSQPTPGSSHSECRAPSRPHSPNVEFGPLAFAALMPSLLGRRRLQPPQ